MDTRNWPQPPARTLPPPPQQQFENNAHGTYSNGYNCNTQRGHIFDNARTVSLAILAQAQGKTLADNSMSNILSEQASYERELESLTRQLRDLEQKASTRDALNQLAILGEQKMNHAAMLQKDIAMRANQILQIQCIVHFLNDLLQILFFLNYSNF